MRTATDPNLTLAYDPAQFALAALTRAGLRAADDALRSNTHMVVAEDGKVQHVSPQDYLRSRQQMPTVSAEKPDSPAD